MCVGLMLDYAHRQWEQQLAKQRALTRRHLTVPREFGTNNTRSPAEKAAQERKVSQPRRGLMLRPPVRLSSCLLH